MKGKRTDLQSPSVISPPPAVKVQKRPARGKPAAVAGIAGKKIRKVQIGAMPASPAPHHQQQPHVVASSTSPLPEEPDLVFDGVLELDGWCWDAVDEEKLLGWFPFVDEDFPCFWSENRGWSPGFFWEDYHDIWHLKHIHEIPNSANR